MRLVLFDCYGTLVHASRPDPALLSAELAERAGLGDRHAQFVIFTLYAGLLVPERDQPATTEAVSQTLERIGRPDIADVVYETLWDAMGNGRGACSAVDGAADLLDDLRARGLTVGVVSNCVLPPPDMVRLLDGVGFAGRVDRYHFSSEGRGKKPAPEFFAAAAEGFDAADVVMVGDDPRYDIEPARALGWTAVRVEPNGADWSTVYAALG